MYDFSMQRPTSIISSFVRFCLDCSCSVACTSLTHIKMAVPSVALNVECIMTQTKLTGISPGHQQSSTACTVAGFSFNFFTLWDFEIVLRAVFENFCSLIKQEMVTTLEIFYIICMYIYIVFWSVWLIWQSFLPLARICE